MFLILKSSLYTVNEHIYVKARLVGQLYCFFSAPTFSCRSLTYKTTALIFTVYILRFYVFFIKLHNKHRPFLYVILTVP